MYTPTVTEIRCSICEKEFCAEIDEKGNCPSCNARYMWVEKKNFFEVYCYKCHRKIEVERLKDGTCQYCGNLYKWGETIPTLFHLEPEAYILWKDKND